MSSLQDFIFFLFSMFFLCMRHWRSSYYSFLHNFMCSKNFNDNVIFFCFVYLHLVYNYIFTREIAQHWRAAHTYIVATLLHNYSVVLQLLYAATFVRSKDLRKEWFRFITTQQWGICWCLIQYTLMSTFSIWKTLILFYRIKNAFRLSLVDLIKA